MDPSPNDPRSSNPRSSNLSSSDPSSRDPRSSNPRSSNPRSSNLSSSDPSSRDPHSNDPGSNDPGSNDPRSNDPRSYPRRRAVTRGFRLGAPRTAALDPEGGSVVFLRSDGPTDPVNHLWRATWDESGLSEQKVVDAAELLGGDVEDLPQQERARRERLREVSGGITGYSVDRAFQHVCFPLSGLVFHHDLATGQTKRLGSQHGLANPVIDPTGRRVAATRAGSLLLLDVADGSSRVLRQPGSPAASWGSAEFIAAEEMDRQSGIWWAPDGESLLVEHFDEEPVARWYIADPANPDRQPSPQRYPAAGTANARVRLHLLGTDGSGREVAWDTESYEYLARVHWGDHGSPLIAVQNRAQTRVRVLTVDLHSGAVSPVVEESSDPWVELVPGVPRRTAAGVLHAVVDPQTNTRGLELLAETGNVTTPAGLQVSAVTGDDLDGVTFVGHDGDPATRDVWRLGWDGRVRRLSDPGGWTVGIHRSGVSVMAAAAADEPASTTLVADRSGRRHPLASVAERPGVSARPAFLTEDGWSRIAVLMPAEPASAALPIILSPYGGPHSGRSIKAGASFLTEQWLADQGYCVVVADGPGSPSSPSNEAAIHGDLASGPLAGQVSALQRVVDHFGGAVDPGRVGIRGWSFGGYLAALAVMERPDVFHAAVAGAPVTDWSLYDTHYTERYLGMPQSEPDAYTRSSLLARADRLRRPLLLIHGMADDNVVVAHTLRLSAALLASGRAHSVLPLSGVTHMTPQEVVAENLLRTELDFFETHLGAG